MSRLRLGPACAVGLALIALTPAFVAAKKAAKPRDVVWTHPQIEQLRPREIALLPPVSFTDDVRPIRYLASRWMQGFYESGHRWRSATYCAERMDFATRGRDSLYRMLARQVRSKGQVDSATAAILCRVVGSQSIMILRIDRWENVNVRAMIDLSATLMDSAGRVLWKCSGGGSAGGYQTAGGTTGGSGVETSDAGHFASPRGGWVPSYNLPSVSTRPGVAGDNPSLGSSAVVQQNFMNAAGILLARWAELLPKAPESQVSTRP
jgi:hypothetical protein